MTTPSCTYWVMRPRRASSILILLVACGPSPSPAPPTTGDGAWFCPKARFETCYQTRRECVDTYPRDICVLTRPVFCETDTTCFATRDDCEVDSICYVR